MRTVFPSRSRRRRAPVEVRKIVPPPPPEPNAWADVLPPARKACKRVGCPETFPTNGAQAFCTTRCKYEHEYQVNKSPTKIKQCARPGCGNTFPDRRGGPLYCVDCRKIVRKKIKQAWQLRNRERINPIRAAQQRARRARGRRRNTNMSRRKCSRAIMRGSRRLKRCNANAARYFSKRITENIAEAIVR